MKIYKTTDYFNITKEQAGKFVNDFDDTKEEAKVLDIGLEHHFYNTLNGLMTDYNSDKRKAYTNRYGYETLLFEFVTDNTNHNKYCMVFR